MNRLQWMVFSLLMGLSSSKIHFEKSSGEIPPGIPRLKWGRLRDVKSWRPVIWNPTCKNFELEGDRGDPHSKQAYIISGNKLHTFHLGVENGHEETACKVLDHSDGSTEGTVVILEKNISRFREGIYFCVACQKGRDMRLLYHDGMVVSNGANGTACKEPTLFFDTTGVYMPSFKRFPLVKEYSLFRRQLGKIRNVLTWQCIDFNQSLHIQPEYIPCEDAREINIYDFIELQDESGLSRHEILVDSVSYKYFRILRNLVEYSRIEWNTCLSVRGTTFNFRNCSPTPSYRAIQSDEVLPPDLFSFVSLEEKQRSGYIIKMDGNIQQCVTRYGGIVSVINCGNVTKDKAFYFDANNATIGASKTFLTASGRHITDSRVLGSRWISKRSSGKPAIVLLSSEPRPYMCLKVTRIGTVNTSYCGNQPPHHWLIEEEPVFEESGEQPEEQNMSSSSGTSQTPSSPQSRWDHIQTQPSETNQSLIYPRPMEEAGANHTMTIENYRIGNETDV